MVGRQAVFECVPVSLSCDVQLEVVCPFVCGQPFSGSSGRLCVDGTFCPASVFSDSAIFLKCPVFRKEIRRGKI